MSSSFIPNATLLVSSVQPVATNMPRRVSFGSTPGPERPLNSRTSTKTTSNTSPKSSEIHRTLYDYSVSKSPVNSTLNQFVSAEKLKSISDLDKEAEARMAKSHKENTTKGVVGVMNWLGKKVKGDGAKEE